MTERRAKTLSLTFLMGLCLLFILNQIAGSINFDANTWVFPRIIPNLNPPLGVDFSITVHKSLSLLQGISPYLQAEWYPPFVYLLYLPFALMDYHTAYCLQVILLCVANFLSIYFSLHLSADALQREWQLKPIEKVFGFSLCLWFILISLFTSYGFAFSLERGNSDAFAMFFSVLCLWTLIKRPEKIWLATLALSIAIHIKVYPLILVALLFWKYGKRSLVPLLVLNSALLFILGPWNGIHFLAGLHQLANAPYVWIGNHSAAAWTQTIMDTATRNIPVWTAFFTGLPLVIWALGAHRLFKNRFNEASAILLFGSSIPLMEVLPSTSHDYKLVISSISIGILLAFLTMEYFQAGKKKTLFPIAFTLILTIFISRSYVISHSPWIAHKYGLIILFQALLGRTIYVWTNKSMQQARKMSLPI